MDVLLLIFLIFFAVIGLSVTGWIFKGLNFIGSEVIGGGLDGCGEGCGCVVQLLIGIFLVYVLMALL